MRQADLHRFRAQAGQRLHCAAHRRLHLRLDAHREVFPWQADAQPAQVRAVQGGGVIGHRQRHGGGVSRVMPGHHPQQQGGVAHGAGQRPGLIQRGGVGDQAVAGDAPVAGLQPDRAGQGRRLADAAAGIRAQRAGNHPRRDGRRAAAAAAAGHAAQVPGVARGEVAGILRAGPHRELVSVGLADQDRPAVEQALDTGGRVRRPEAFQDAAAGRGLDAPRGDDVLDRQGDAQQRGALPGGAAAIGSGGLFQGQLVGQGEEGPHLRVKLADACQAGFGQGQGGDRAPVELFQRSRDREIDHDRPWTDVSGACCGEYTTPGGQAARRGGAALLPDLPASSPFPACRFRSPLFSRPLTSCLSLHSTRRDIPATLERAPPAMPRAARCPNSSASTPT